MRKLIYTQPRPILYIKEHRPQIADNSRKKGKERARSAACELAPLELQIDTQKLKGIYISIDELYS